MDKMRHQVLRAFKQLHRTRQAVFIGDQIALEESRKKINADFKKNKNVNNKEAIDELLKLSQDVERELRLSVIQAEEVGPGRYQLNMRPEVTRLDNVPYNECANVQPTSKRQSQSACSSSLLNAKT